jgi:hypothetical protein
MKYDMTPTSTPIEGANFTVNGATVVVADFNYISKKKSHEHFVFGFLIGMVCGYVLYSQLLRRAFLRQMH